MIIRHSLTVQPTRLLALGTVYLLSACSHAEAAPGRTNTPFGGGRAVTLEPVPPTARRAGHRLIFVCRDRDPVVFSDRPCEQQPGLQTDGESRSPGRPASTVPGLSMVGTMTPAQSVGRPPDGHSNSARCRRIQSRLENLEEKMRRGYPMSDSAQLWGQHRGLSRQWREDGC